MYRNTRRPRYVSKKAVLGIGVVSGVRLDGQMGVSAPSLHSDSPLNANLLWRLPTRLLHTAPCFPCHISLPV